MQLGAHLRPLNLPATITQLGRIGLLMGLLFLVPALAAAALGEWAQGAVFAGVAAGMALLGWAGSRQRRDDIGLTEGLVITASAYLLVAVVGALPFLGVAGFADAFFESMSGFTTTGLTVMPLPELPRSLLFYRAFSQWVGGGGIVVLTLAILLRASGAAHRLYASEAGDEPLVGTVRATARTIARTYLALTVVATGALLMAGLGPFDAAVHAFSSVSTGGFSPWSDSIGHSPGWPVRVVVLVLMLAGAISFPLYGEIRAKGVLQVLRDPQLRALGAGVVLGSCAMVVADGADDAAESVFHAASALTTTGFSLVPAAEWGDQTRAVAVLLMVIGGSAGSTAGGIKLVRLLVLLRLGRWLIARTLLPEEAKIPVRRGGLVIPEGDLLRLTALVVLYLAVLAASSGLLTLGGHPVGDAVFEATSALGTVGLSSGVTSPDLPVWQKLVLVMNMWLGRLEIVPVLVLLYPAVWRRP